jgi:hypothetical protein
LCRMRRHSLSSLPSASCNSTTAGKGQGGSLFFFGLVGFDNPIPFGSSKGIWFLCNCLPFGMLC